MDRYCIFCGDEIEESMGICLARDVVDFEEGRRIREICGVDALRLEMCTPEWKRYVLQNLEDYTR